MAAPTTTYVCTLCGHEKTWQTSFLPFVSESSKLFHACDGLGLRIPKEVYDRINATPEEGS